MRRGCENHFKRVKRTTFANDGMAVLHRVVDQFEPSILIPDEVR